jgi:2-oxoglutarate ferredoxin oxidoreductase subunit alpha
VVARYDANTPNESIAVMTWGGSKGPTLEAYNALIAQGQRIAWYYTMQLHPLPPKLLEELKRKDLVIVPELNYQGQFSSILRSLGVRAESITQYTGLPFKVRDLMEKISGMVNSQKRGMVEA